jgi:hypothetical protein
LKLRVEAKKKKMQFDVGNGRKIHLWTDWWHPSGVLLDESGYQVISYAHSRLDARLSTVITDGEWFWGPARSDSLVEIQSKLSMLTLGGNDIPKWMVYKSGNYCSADTWEALRDRHPDMEWWYGFFNNSKACIHFMVGYA